MPKKVWKDENYIHAYELAKSGMSEIKMAQALGVSTATLRKWKDTKPALRFAIEKASSSGYGMRYRLLSTKTTPS